MYTPNLTRSEIRHVVDGLVLRGTPDEKCRQAVDELIVDRICARVCREPDLVAPFARQYLDQELQERESLRMKNSGKTSSKSPAGVGSGRAVRPEMDTVSAGSTGEAG